MNNKESMLLGVSARSLFDLKYETSILNKEGLKAYREYQRQNVDKALKPGVAYRFVQRMLSLNSIVDKGSPLVELAVISRMDPDTGCRVMQSLSSLNLDASISVFTSGMDTSKYLRSLDVKLYLSMDDNSVKKAIDNNLPAGTILTRKPITEHDTGDGDIRVAFDFDGCIGSDSSESIFRKDGLEAFNRNEIENFELPIDPGPMFEFIKGLSHIQKAEIQYADKHKDYHRRLSIGIITARNAIAGIRVMKTLDAWGISVDDAFYMGGHDKTPVLSAYHPHLFLDDSPRNIQSARTTVTSVHVPFGIANPTTSDEQEKK
jgi:5'-nucleotidase